MSDGGAFSMGFANAYRMMMDREEKKRQEEANRAIGQMYIESLRAPADAAVAPYQANAITGREKAFDAQTRAEASKMTDMAIASNPALTHRVVGTNAPVTPEMQAGFAINNQAALGQANQQAQGADQMLALAKEKYGTAMFDRLGPIVASGKVPPQAMIAIIEKQVLQAEKTALKQAQKNAYKEAMALMKEGKVDEAKMRIAEYASPEGQGRLLASIGQGAGIQGKVELRNGNIGVMDKTGKIVDTGVPFYVKPDKPGVTFSDTTFKDETGREYQLDSKGQRHYAPRPVLPKDTQMKDINDAESRELSYLRLQASQNKFPTPGQVKEMEKQARQIQMKYQGMREGMKQNKQQTTGNIDLNNLTPEQLDQARQLKELGLTKEQIAEELRFRASGAKGR